MMSYPLVLYFCILKSSTWVGICPPKSILVAPMSLFIEKIILVTFVNFFYQIFFVNDDLLNLYFLTTLNML